MSRSDYVPDWACPEVTVGPTELNMSRNVVYRSGHLPKRPARPPLPEQNTGESSRIAMSTSVAKVYYHRSKFPTPIKSLFLRNRINSTCMLFLLM